MVGPCELKYIMLGTCRPKLVLRPDLSPYHTIISFLGLRWVGKNNSIRVGHT